MRRPDHYPMESAIPRARRDYRLGGVLFLIVAIVVLGYAVTFLPARGVKAERIARETNPANAGFTSLAEPNAVAQRDEIEPDAVAPPVSTDNSESGKVRQVFEQANAEIKARQFDQALLTLNDARSLLQRYAEAYLLIGRALEGKRDYATARDFYLAAIDRNPYLADAHWGFATTSESLGDLESALGGMRSYLHTDPDPDPQRLRINQARSAIWEWEAKLGRGPWGPTRGLPPGFTADELNRDGKGVAVKMPLPDTAQADGTMKYEIKHADKIKIYPRP